MKPKAVRGRNVFPGAHRRLAAGSPQKPKYLSLRPGRFANAAGAPAKPAADSRPT
jgi:hypothetical protein